MLVEQPDSARVSCTFSRARVPTYIYVYIYTYIVSHTTVSSLSAILFFFSPGVSPNGPKFVRENRGCWCGVDGSYRARVFPLLRVHRDVGQPTWLGMPSVPRNKDMTCLHSEIHTQRTYNIARNDTSEFRPRARPSLRFDIEKRARADERASRVASPLTFDPAVPFVT